MPPPSPSLSPNAITVRSKGIPGLKYLGVWVKWMVYGDVTMRMPVRCASTMSLPAVATGMAVSPGASAGLPVPPPRDSPV